MDNLTIASFLRPAATNGNLARKTNLLLSGKIPAPLLSVWSLVSFVAFRDSLKLLVLGGAFDAARDVLRNLWARLIRSMFVTAEFDRRDDTFAWIMFWLSRHPSWNKSRNVRVTTQRLGHVGIADIVPGEEENTDPRRLIAYVPTYGVTQYMWFKRLLMSVTLNRHEAQGWQWQDDEKLSITLYTRSLSSLSSLLLEAKLAYKQNTEGRINIYVANQYSEWRLAGSRPKRPLSSVVLDQGVKEKILADAKEFMESERWYAERGIPWRRGYLFHGHPGTGKTSLIYSLAGELDLNIYVISPSTKGLDDSVLGQLLSRLPSRSVALMEDIDAAFFHGLTRETDQAFDEANEGEAAADAVMGPPTNAPARGSSVTLSGLLSAIDGVAAGEGRLLFATTNKYSALDPALTRPGRLDVHVWFDKAGKWQAEELFRCFFHPNTKKASKRFSDGARISASSADDLQEIVDQFNETSDKKSDGPVSLPPGLERALSAGSVSASTSADHCPKLTEEELDSLARAFAARIPDREFSMAAIQSLLMQYKTRPFLIVDEVDKWVEAERKKKSDGERKRSNPKVSKPEQKDRSMTLILKPDYTVPAALEPST